MKGNQGYSIKEVVQMMDNAINEKVDAVFINIEVSERKEQLLDLRVSVLEAEEERLNGECTICLLYTSLDLEKYFDTVNHSRLIQILVNSKIKITKKVGIIITSFGNEKLS